MKAKTAAEVFPPGDRLKEELDARGWTQGDLAEILGRPPRLVSEIISAKRSITAETAHGLGQALGTGPELWMTLESQYQLARTSPKESAVGRRTQIYGQFPVKEMQRRGWLKPGTSLDEVEDELRSFFNISSLDSGINIPHAAKKTSYDKVSMQQAAWLVRAQKLAAKAQVSTYAADKLPALFDELRACVAQPEDSSRVAGILASYGIRLLLIAPLPGSKIDAACMWFENQPLVVLTLRYDKHDIFWHALYHELDHIEHNEGRSQPIVDTNLQDSTDRDESEKRANRHAAEKLIPRPELEGFIATVSPYFSESAILSFATRMDVHPGIVVGQLQHRGLIPWSTYSGYKVRIREFVTSTAIVDGF